MPRPIPRRALARNAAEGGAESVVAGAESMLYGMQVGMEIFAAQLAAGRNM